MGNMTQVSFDVSKTEQKTIREIADRAVAMASSENIDYDRTVAMMDITATHANGCPLRLSELLAAEPFDFAHDVFGIRRHLNRKTGQLEHHFTPRYAR
jgi:hypothetical protein